MVFNKRGDRAGRRIGADLPVSLSGVILVMLAGAGEGPGSCCLDGVTPGAGIEYRAGYK